VSFTVDEIRVLALIARLDDFPRQRTMLEFEDGDREVIAGLARDGLVQLRRGEVLEVAPPVVESLEPAFHTGGLARDGTCRRAIELDGDRDQTWPWGGSVSSRHTAPHSQLQRSLTPITST
jgi:hypothetical protein